MDGVGLRIEQGELFGILGQNGAGKTTLIRMLSSALVPSSGSATVAGHHVVREASRVRAAIGLVSSEERSFFARLTGRENLEFFSALYRIPRSEARRRIEELLGRVDLVESADRPFRTYSTGMRQRLAIARGLMSEPQILFMDEPTRSLDPISARDVRRLVAEYVVGELGRTVILATNSMTEAEELCDRVALLRAGRVVAGGSMDDLRRMLHYGVRCDLRLADVPAGLPESLRRLPGVLDLEVAREPGARLLRLTLGEEGPVLAAVLRETVERGAEIFGCATSEVSLEEIYVRELDEPPAPREAVAC